MAFKEVAMIVVVCCLYVACGPHTHKKFGSKESVEHGSYAVHDTIHYKNGKHDNEFDHEAVLGSHKVAEQYDNLSPEDAKERLRSLALKMDLDEDGYVNKAELVEWVINSFKSLTVEESMDELEDEDANSDGEVTWQEHVAETYDMNENTIVKTEESTEEIEMFVNDKELFDAADLNKDGKLDKAEYPAFSHPEEFKHMHTIVYNQAMKKKDSNKDGFLSFEEFISDVHGSAPVPTTENYVMEKDRFQNDYDLNGDHLLNKEEVLLWLIPNNLEAAKNEAEHLIESSDENKDDKLSIKEIVDNHDIFVGSEATDFGNHLKTTHLFEDEL